MQRQRNAATPSPAEYPAPEPAGGSREAWSPTGSPAKASSAQSARLSGGYSRRLGFDSSVAAAVGEAGEFRRERLGATDREGSPRGGDWGGGGGLKEAIRSSQKNRLGAVGLSSAITAAGRAQAGKGWGF